MAYTIPEYVDTPEQAILAVASAVKGEQVTGGDGSVNTALDILADTLAQQDVQVPQTDAGAILALAQYVSGGGGPELGAVVISFIDSVRPAVGSVPDDPWEYYVNSISVGGSLVAENYEGLSGAVASGVQIETLPVEGVDHATGFIVTRDGNEYATVEEWSGTITATPTDGACVFSFTMPEVSEGQQFIVYPWSE